MEEFDLKPEQDFIELFKLLKVMGLCESGGQAKLLIGEGYVTVDGQLETRKRCKIRSGQVVEFEGQTVKVI